MRSPWTPHTHTESAGFQFSQVSAVNNPSPRTRNRRTHAGFTSLPFLADGNPPKQGPQREEITREVDLKGFTPKQKMADLNLVLTSNLNWFNTIPASGDDLGATVAGVALLQAGEEAAGAHAAAGEWRRSPEMFYPLGNKTEIKQSIFQDLFIQIPWVSLWFLIVVSFGCRAVVWFPSQPTESAPKPQTDDVRQGA